MSEHGDTPSPQSTGPTRSISPPSLTQATEPTTSPSPKKRTAPENKVTKRRAARACTQCRARKVRCDVVENSPCGNCRWDGSICEVPDSRRRKKNFAYSGGSATVGVRAGSAEVLPTKVLNASVPINIAAAATNPGFNLYSGGNGSGLTVPMYQNPGGYRTAGNEPSAAQSGFGPLAPGVPATTPLGFGPLSSLLATPLEQPDELPLFIKPIPSKIGPDERWYLAHKKALTLPPVPLQNALLKAYVEYVHPYMPLLELHDFLNVVSHRDGSAGQVSLFLYQSVMFVATAFVDEQHLKDAGHENRRAARKTLFGRTRLLYDFDYETDRLVLVQALLLMAYWYETPDDQKDTWHWIGVAISLAHTIGLHRDPANTIMAPPRQGLWKRVWWCCYMRDRLVALGMRRPTRIKQEDFDVPMLVEADFEIAVLPEENQLLGSDCALLRDVEMQRELALMCIEKAKLCVLVGQMLKVQYSVLSRDGIRPENTTNSTMMLLPNKKTSNPEDIQKVDDDLASWLRNLPEACQYRPLDSIGMTEQNTPLVVHNAVLHLVYHTTLSALHRPLFFGGSSAEAPGISQQMQETARIRVRDTAHHVTVMAAELRRHGLVRYLPTTGVTVILPAMIVNLIDIKSECPETRARATHGFKECFHVMNDFRNTYAAADFATNFLDAALRRGVLVNPVVPQPQPQPQPQLQPQPQSQSRGAKVLHRTLAPGFIGMPQMPSRPSTPPPENNTAFLNPAEVGLYQQSQAYMLATGDVDVGLGIPRGYTPPQTDESDATPPADELPDGLPTAGEPMDYAMTGAGNGNGEGGNNFDIDQWLQFPAEGVDETFMGDMFDSVNHSVDAANRDLDIWMGSMHPRLNV
ncbi:Transcription factor CTF1 [Madurella fahalii]|uniref:Transcription factor CTF1 n=1 Tax=Madurella fahalii TaxID=1157608 RepID=A0ABQ0G8S9_9PEZI